MTRQRVNPIRIAVLGALLLVALTQLPGASRALDIFDSCPPLRILFIGNSHTHANDMPGMVRRIADGAGVKQRYDITMHAPGGMKFQDHWGDLRVQDLLKQPWDHIILQGASGETLHDDSLRPFNTYGNRLARLANATGARSWLYVTWAYHPDGPWMRENPYWKDRMQGMAQSAYRKLSKATGAPLINVGQVWSTVHNARPGFSLYASDGNHATPHGSYLAALMMFKHISGASPKATTYRPTGIDEREAEYMRTMAASG